MQVRQEDEVNDRRYPPRWSDRKRTVANAFTREMRARGWEVRNVVVFATPPFATPVPRQRVVRVTADAKPLRNGSRHRLQFVRYRFGRAAWEYCRRGRPGVPFNCRAVREHPPRQEWLVAEVDGLDVKFLSKKVVK